jgi:hypothetical protein
MAPPGADADADADRAAGPCRACCGPPGPCAACSRRRAAARSGRWRPANQLPCRCPALQVRLKADILREAQQFGNQILVSQEDDDMQVGARLLACRGWRAQQQQQQQQEQERGGSCVVLRWGRTGACQPQPEVQRSRGGAAGRRAPRSRAAAQVHEVWEPVTEADVQTPLEVYAELQADGYDVDYTRIPVTDEKAPKDVRGSGAAWLHACLPACLPGCPPAWLPARPPGWRAAWLLQGLPADAGCGSSRPARPPGPTSPHLTPPHPPPPARRATLRCWWRASTRCPRARR